MEEKNNRLSAIKKIIQHNRINNQEVLQQHMVEAGFKVTQATLSRDLKHLQVIKTSDGKGSYYYTALKGEALAISQQTYSKDLERGCLSLEFSGNFGVIKTLPGHAGSVAFALDNLAISEIIGTIAGDDTILIIGADGITRDRLRASLESWIPNIKEE